jgi:aspartate aminotransferase
MFVINSPSNPSGQIYSRNELSALAKVLVKYPNIIIASDDMYEHIVWKKGDFSNILNVCPELYNRTIVLNGVSKAYSMTGWRIGYAAGHPDIIKAMKKIQSQSTSGPTSISQYAAVAALNGDKDCILEMNDNFHKRHDFIVDELNSIKGISCLKSTGTFYAFANIEELMKSLGIATDVEFCSYLLEKIGVAVVPGSAFGIKNHIRLSYASKEDVLKDAISRMHKIFS